MHFFANINQLLIITTNLYRDGLQSIAVVQTCLTSLWLWPLSLLQIFYGNIYIKVRNTRWIELIYFYFTPFTFVYNVINWYFHYVVYLFSLIKGDRSDGYGFKIVIWVTTIRQYDYGLFSSYKYKWENWSVIKYKQT